MSSMFDSMDISAMIPAFVTDFIKNLTSAQNGSELVNNIITMVGDMFPLGEYEEYMSIIIPAVNGSFESTLLEALNVNLSAYTSMVTDYYDQIVEQLNNPDYRDYYGQVQALESVTFNQFLDQLLGIEEECTYYWCRMQSADMITSISTMLQDKVGGLVPQLKPLVAFSTPGELITRLELILYCAVLAIPALIFLISFLCMLTHRVCCSCCSIWCCPACQLCVSIFGIILLMFSFISSGFIVPFMNTMATNITSIADQGLEFVGEEGLFKTSMEYPLPSISYVTFEEQSLSIDLSSLDSIFNSIHINISLPNITDLVDQKAGGMLTAGMASEVLGMFDANATAIIAKVGRVLQDLLGNYINITLAGSSVDYLFDSENARGILGMIKINGVPIHQWLINDTLKPLLEGLLSNDFKLLYDLVNFSTIIEKIQTLDVFEIVEQMMGMDVNAMMNQFLGMLSPLLQQAYCAIDEVKSYNGPTTYLTIFDDITAVLKQINAGATPVLPTITIQSTTIKLLEDYLATIWLEYCVSNSSCHDSITSLSLIIEEEETYEYLEEQITLDAQAKLFMSEIQANATAVDSFLADVKLNAPSNMSEIQTAIQGPNPQPSDLVVIPDIIFTVLEKRGIISNPDKTMPTQVTDPNFADYCKWELMYFAYYKYIDQLQTSYPSSFDDATAMADRVIHAINLVSLVDLALQLQPLMMSLNDVYLGSDQIDVTCPDPEESTPVAAASFIGNALDLVNTIVLGFLQNVLYVLAPADLTINSVNVTNWNNLLQQSFENASLFSNITTDLTDLLYSVLDFIIGNKSMINSQLFGLLPSTFSGFVSTVFFFFDAFSFAAFLTSVFCFCGPCTMCCGYQYNKYYKEERKWAKKYKFTMHGVKMCGKEPEKKVVKAKHGKHHKHYEDEEEIQQSDDQAYDNSRVQYNDRDRVIESNSRMFRPAREDDF